MNENLSAEWRQVLAGWSEVKIESLACEFFEICQGDARRLLCSVNEDTGIYGNLALRVLKVNNFFARTSLRNFWVDNKRDIKKFYAKLKYPRAKNPPKLTDGIQVGTPIEKYCWCETRIDGYSIMCDVCKHWFHILCCGLTEEQAIGMGEFVCLICRGSPKVPKIWIESQQCEDLETAAKLDVRNGPMKTDAHSKKTFRMTTFHAPRDLNSEICWEDIQGTEVLTPKLQRTVPAATLPDKLAEKVKPTMEQTGEKSECHSHPPEQRSVEASACKAKHDGVVDACGIPSEFIISMTKEDWNKIVCRKVTKDGGTVYEATSNYPSILTPYFNSTNHICVIVGKKKTLTYPVPRGSSAAFYIARAICKAHECPAKYTFTVQQRPKKKAKQIDIYVKRSGTIHHLHGIKISRPLKGTDRDEAKDALQLKKPGIYRREKFGLADTKQLQAWNYNMVKELKVYQQANFERKSEDDFHQDPVVDTVITSFHQKHHSAKKKLPGFVQSISMDPFFVVMFCEDQLRFLQALTKKRDVVLFLDATGTLGRRLPKPFPQTAMYYYAMVAKPGPHESAVPILEFYSASHDASTIETCLRTFFSSFKKFCSIRGKGFGIVRIEIDFSKALMAAVSNVFQRGDVEEYIHFLWACLVDPNGLYSSYYAKPMIAIHICRIHVNRFWGRKIDRTFTRKPSAETVRTFYKDWMVKFIRTKSLQSIQRRMFDALIISGSLYMTDEVKRRLRDIHLPTNYNDYEQLIQFQEIDRNTEEPFYRRSMFGKMTSIITERVTNLNDEAMRAIQLGAKLEKNEFYSITIFDYLVVHVLPYAPMLNQTVFKVFNQPVDDDTTNNVENWIGLLKRDYFKGERNIKIGRLARAHHTLIAGSIIQAIAAINGLKEHLPDMHADDEDDIFEGIDPLLHEEVSNLEGQTPPEDVSSPSENNGHRNKSSGEYHSKRTLSPEQASEIWGAKKSQLHRKAQHVVFGMPVIPTGAKFSKCGQVYTISNTCNVDTTIQVLYYLYTYTNCHSYFESVLQDDEFSTSLRKIIHEVEKKSFDVARVEWMQSILGLNLESDYNIYGSESDNGTSHVSAWLCSFERHEACLNDACQRSKTSKTSLTEIKGINSADVLQKLHHGEVKENWCRRCQSSCKISFSCQEISDLLVYTCDGLVTEGGVTLNHSKERDLLMTQSIFGSLYEVLAYTCYTGNHFYSVIAVEGTRYTVDGSRGAIEHRRSFSEFDSVSSIWLHRKT